MKPLPTVLSIAPNRSSFFFTSEDLPAFIAAIAQTFIHVTFFARLVTLEVGSRIVPKEK